MKRITVCLLLVLLSTGFVYAEVTRKHYQSYQDRDWGYVFYSGGKEIARETWGRRGTKVTGKIPDGVVKEYHESGKLKVESNYKDNKEDGTTRYYSKNGQLVGENDFRHGKLHGIALAYYESGKLRSEIYYFEDEPLGIMKFYYESGTIERTMTVKGSRLTSKNEYDKNGNLIEELINTFEHSKWKSIKKMYYYEDGTIKEIKTLENGQVIDKKEYDESGKLIKENKNTPEKTK